MVGADFTRTCEGCEHVDKGYPRVSVLCSRRLPGLYSRHRKI